ncbi:MAG UNVERIFIED_CONTAM: hypothetical protein LVT10_16440 [Anaerolineae bacterium]
MGRTRRGVDVKNRILAALMEHADVVGVSGNLVSLSTKDFASNNSASQKTAL